MQMRDQPEEVVIHSKSSPEQSLKSTSWIYSNICDSYDFRQPNVEEECEVSDLVSKFVRKTKYDSVNIEHELKSEECGWLCVRME